MFRFDRHIPRDVRHVLRTAALLSIGEFEVFRLAWTHWYGREGDEATIEAHFLPYMFGDRVPHWVRSFTRKVLSSEREGNLDPALLGVHQPRYDPREAHRGRFFLLVIAMTLVTLFLAARLAAPLLGISECIFPPCY